MAENILNAFDTDAYNVASMTDAVNKLPFVPSRLGGMGLFKTDGITTDIVVMEEKDGHLSLLQSKRRGEPGTTAKTEGRKVRSFQVPHLPHDDTILAADVSGVRAFGSATEVEGVATVVNNRLSVMRQAHEITLEYQRAKALQGLLLDADATVIYDFWDEFGLKEQKVDFVLGTTTTDVRAKCLDVVEKVETAVGSMPYDHIHAMCGATWFKKFIGHTLVRDAFSRYRDGEFLRNDPRRGFEFAGITFEAYRGTVSGQTFVPATLARFFPVGAQGLFRTHFAPADFIEAVNTIGLAVYAKQEIMKFGRGIEIHTQSNPFSYCTRPYCLVKGSTSN